MLDVGFELLAAFCFSVDVIGFFFFCFIFLLGNSCSTPLEEKVIRMYFLFSPLVYLFCKLMFARITEE